MREIAGALARVLSLLCAALLALTLCAAVLLVNAQVTLFDADLYKGALKSEDLYARLPALLAGQIVASLSGGPCERDILACLPAQPSPLRTCLQDKLAPDAFSALTGDTRTPSQAENAVITACMAQFGQIPIPAGQQAPFYAKILNEPDLEVLIRNMVPPAQLQIISEQTIDSFFDFLNGKNDNPLVSIAPIKKTLAANSSAAISAILGSKPACSADQLASIFNALLAGQAPDDSMLCNLPAQVLSLAMPLVTDIFNSQIDTIPDSIPIFLQVPLQERATISRVRQYIQISPLFPIILLLLLTVLAVRSLRGLLVWWGWPLFAGGLLTIIIGLAAGPVLRMGITLTFLRNNSLLDPRLSNTALDLFQTLLKDMFQPVLFQSLILLTSGAFMLIAARSWEIKNKRKLVKRG